MNTRLLGLAFLVSLGLGTASAMNIAVTLETDEYAGALTAYDVNGSQIGTAYANTETYGTHWTFTFQLTIPNDYIGRSISFGYGSKYSDLVSASASVSVPYGGLSFDQVQTLAATEVGGDLIVGGNIDMSGNVLNIGTNLFNYYEPAFSLQINNSDDGYLVQKNVCTSSFSKWIWSSLGWGDLMTLSTDDGLTILTVDGFISAGTIYSHNSPVLTTASAANQFLSAQPLKLAIGTGVLASGTNSFAAGNGVTASGSDAAAFGLGTTAQSFSSVAIGRYNIAQGNQTSWIPTDDLFVIGNGTSASAPSNAFTVKKNGGVAVGPYGVNSNAALTVSPLDSSPTSGGIYIKQESTAGAQANPALAFGTGGASKQWWVDNYGINRTAGIVIGETAFPNPYFLDYAAGLNVVNKSGASAGVFTTDYAADDRAILAFKSKNSGPIYAGAAYNQASGQSQFALYNGFGTPSAPMLVVNDNAVGNGNVGIGTPTPTAKLHVEGGAKVNGDVNVAGKVRVWPSGDISMGDFKSGAKPTIGADPDAP